jgi:hypothetical protein
VVAVLGTALFNICGVEFVSCGVEELRIINAGVDACCCIEAINSACVCADTGLVLATILRHTAIFMAVVIFFILKKSFFLMTWID